MSHIRVLGQIIGAILLSIFLVGGGDLPPTSPINSFSFTSADCNSVSFSYDEGPVFLETRASISPSDVDIQPPVAYGPSFYEVIHTEEGLLAGTGSFIFDSPLTVPTTITLTLEFYFPGDDFPFAEETISVAVDCPGGEATILTSGGEVFGCNDDRLNQTLCEPIAMYAIENDEGLGMDIWEIDPASSEGTQVLYLSGETLDALFTAGTDVFCTVAISADGRTGVYLYPDNRLLVVNGPDFENKYFGFTYETYPSSPTPSTYLGDSLPGGPDC